MTQFRKKPLLVDAVPVDDILESNPVPEWVREALKPVDETDEGYGAVARVTLIPNGIDIVTKQGQVVGAGSGEWLLRAAPDDLWPIDGDVFEASYERPDVPAETIGSDLELDALLERMRSASDHQRGELLAIIGAGGTSRVGAIIRVAAEQIEGLAPVSARAAFMLAALGILDQAGD